MFFIYIYIKKEKYRVFKILKLLLLKYCFSIPATNLWVFLEVQDFPQVEGVYMGCNSQESKNISKREAYNCY